jgi:hypothetical protein
MMRKGRVLAVIAVLVALALPLALSRPWAGGGVPPTPTLVPPGAGAVTATGAQSTSVAGVRLESLDGALQALDGDVLTRELWSRMRDYNAGDPAIKPYIEWLRNALAPEPHEALNVPWYPRYRYWWFNDRYGWGAEAPGYDAVVRVGVVRLPFGAGLIVTAYQAGNHVDIVVHGTIINETEWMTAVARSFICFEAIPWHSIDRELRNFFHWYRPTGGWVLWRVLLPSLGTYLEVGGVKVRVGTVYVLLEMPAYYSIIDGKPVLDVYFERIEWVYWTVVGEPAFALAYRLALPPDYYADKLYTGIGYISPAEANLLPVELVYSVSLLNVYHPGNDVLVNRYFTPFEERAHGIGVCEDQSRASALFASNALGMLTAYVVIDYSDIDSLLPGHAISVVVYPSTVYRTPATVKLPVDIDGDGVNENADVLVDTAHLDPSYINSHIENVTIELPLMYVRWDVERNCYFYMGFTQAVLSLPGWLKMPWLSRFEGIIEAYMEDAMEQAVSWWHREVWSGTWTRNVTELVAEMEEYDNIAHRLNMTAPPDFWEAVALAVINKTMTAKDFVPPSVALALGKTLGVMQVVYEAHTPELREVLPAEVFEWKPIIRASPPASTWQGGGTGQAHRQETPTLNATIRLAPVYTAVEAPWGEVPVFDGLRGSAVVNGTNVTVVAHNYYGTGEYDVHVYLNGSHAYGIVTSLPATIAFRHGGVEYRITVEAPEPPLLNQSITAELEPFDTMPVLLPNGTEVNVTVYMVNQTIRMGNTTVVLSGYVSRLQLDLDIYVFGVPPASYNVTAMLVLPDGTEAPADGLEAWYQGYLEVRLYHDTPLDSEGYQHPLPQGTLLRITIQPLNLTIVVPIKG